MPSKITLIVTKGGLAGPEIVFQERASCIIGRSGDCDPGIPDDRAHKNVSRHHCLLDINPPAIRIRDFGSKNGTFVNGADIGRREPDETPEEGRKRLYPEHDLVDGDEVGLGSVVSFRVHITQSLVCAECGEELPESEGQESAAGWVAQCEACRAAEKAHRQAPAQPGNSGPKLKACARCGADVGVWPGEGRAHIVLCESCKQDPLGLMQFLLEMADAGEPSVHALRGFTLIGQLGKGGNGVVYLVRRRDTGAPIAVKLMLPRAAASKQGREMFQREIQNTVALKHPNVVALRDSGFCGGVFFLIMDYCDGGSVDLLMNERNTPLLVDEAVAIILQALDGLEYAHGAPIPKVKLEDGTFGPGKGLVHRDIKPSNIFLSGSGSSRIAKVGDYGLSKSFDHAGMSGLTRTGMFAGTLYFVPRQQAADFKYARPEVDVWAMAASLYCMLTGTCPRDFPPNEDPWNVVLKTSAVPILQRNASIPPRLAAVIDEALIDKPEIRYKSAAEFKKALEGAV